MPFRRTLSTIAVALAFAASASAEEITVFAAASLKNALDEVAEAFSRETGHDVSLSLAGSSALARQIQHGAPADVFISANPGWMDMLEEEGVIDVESRFDLLGNAIVLVAHGDQPLEVKIGPDLDLRGMLGEGRLAMALVDAVPAGIYGKSALVSLGLWEEIAPHVAQVDNVRAALALVAVGEAPLGIVYASDPGPLTNVTVAGTFPSDSHPPIIYPAARTDNGLPAAADFLRYLRGSKAREAFERQGFEMMAE